MTDLYEDVGNNTGGYPASEELYEECDAFPEPPPSLPSTNATAYGPNSRHSLPMPLPKPAELSTGQGKKPQQQPVTTVIGDLQAKLENQSGGIPFGVPLRQTNKPRDYFDQKSSVRDPGNRASMPVGPTPTPMTANMGRPPSLLEVDTSQKRLSTGPPSGGFRLPAASIVSSQRPNLRHIEKPSEPSALAKQQRLSPKLAKKSAPPPLASKPGKPPVMAKPSMKELTPPPLPDGNPADLSSPYDAPLPPMPSPGQSAHSPHLPPKPSPIPPPADYQRQSPPSPLPPSPVAPSTIASPTPSSGTGLMVSRYRRVNLASVDANNPPPVPLSSKPTLPPKGGKLQHNESQPVTITRQESFGRRKSVRRPPPSSSPPNSVPPPPPEEPDDMYDDVDKLAEVVNERLAHDDLADDIDEIEESFGGQSQPPPPPGAPPPEIEPEEEEPGEGLYDDVEELGQQVRQNLANLPPPPPDQEDTYEVAGPDDDGGLPPPSDELYDEVPAGAVDGGAMEEQNQFDDGSDSDPLAVESEDWSNDDLDESADDQLEPTTLSAPTGQPVTIGPGGETSNGKPKKSSKNKKKEKKAKREEEKKRREEERLAAKRREKEEKEQQKQREKEEKERQKLVAKQRKHFKVTVDEKKMGVVIAKSTCKNGPEHYLTYRAGEKFDILLKESDKKRKLPANTWLVERQLDGTIGYVEKINMALEQTDEFGYGGESLYEDVGQGAPLSRGPSIQSSGYSLSTGPAHSHHTQTAVNIPPPSMRAPPPPGVPLPQPEGDALYEDLPCNQ